MATRKTTKSTKAPVLNPRNGKVRMRHPESKGTAWFGPSTVAHHEAAGWEVVTESDQPDPAGDTGAPEGDSNTPKEHA